MSKQQRTDRRALERGAEGNLQGRSGQGGGPGRQLPSDSRSRVRQRLARSRSMLSLPSLPPRPSGVDWGQDMHNLLDAAIRRPDRDLESLARSLVRERESGEHDDQWVQQLLKAVQKVLQSDIWKRARASTRLFRDSLHDAGNTRSRWGDDWRANAPRRSDRPRVLRRRRMGYRRLQDRSCDRPHSQAKVEYYRPRCKATSKPGRVLSTNP